MLENAKPCKVCGDVVLATDNGYIDQLCDCHYEMKLNGKQLPKAGDVARPMLDASSSNVVAGVVPLGFSFKTGKSNVGRGKQSYIATKESRPRKTRKDKGGTHNMRKARIKKPVLSEIEKHKRKVLSRERRQAKQVSSNAQDDGLRLLHRRERNEDKLSRHERRWQFVPPSRHCPLCNRGPLLQSRQWVVSRRRRMAICRKCYFTPAVREQLGINKSMPAHYHKAASYAQRLQTVAPL